jgi:hypothetical protein
MLPPLSIRQARGRVGISKTLTFVKEGSSSPFLGCLYLKTLS